MNTKKVATTRAQNVTVMRYDVSVARPQIIANLSAYLSKVVDPPPEIQFVVVVLTTLSS